MITFKEWEERKDKAFQELEDLGRLIEAAAEAWHQVSLVIRTDKPEESEED